MTELKYVTMDDLGAPIEGRCREVETGVGTFRIRPLSAAEMIGYRGVDQGAEKNARQNYEMVARALVGPDGGRLIPEGEEERLGNLPARDFMHLQREVVIDLGLDPDRELTASAAAAVAAADGGTSGGNPPS